MARQLTSIEQSFIARLSTQELVGVDKEPKPKNLQEMVDWSNKLAKWVASEIVLIANAKKRLSVVKQFISLLDVCKSPRVLVYVCVCVCVGM
jgi:son of sevenless